MKRSLPATIAVFLLIIVTVTALEEIPDWETTCYNGTHISKYTTMTINNTIYDIIEDPIRCPYGCNEYRNICNKWPGNAIPGEYFMLFEILALGLLLMSIYKIDFDYDKAKVYDLVLPALGLILFLVLALQGNNVIDAATGEAVQLTMVVWFNYGMALFMLIPFFVNTFKLIYQVRR